MVDSFGRNIEYARISLTDRCNYRCLYCMPNCGIEKKSHSDILSLEDTYKIIEALKDLGIVKVRFTGGEPLVIKGALDIIEKTSKFSGLSTYITTNGVYLSDFAYKLVDCGISGLNISIDSLDEDKYKFVTNGGELSTVLEGIEKVKKAGIENIKVNAVLLKGINDDSILEFAKFGKDNHIEVRFIELMPFSHGDSYIKYGINSAEVISKYNLTKINQKQFTNNTEYYLTEDGNEIGFIRPISSKFCSMCNRIRITADGKMLLCLHQNIEIDLKDSLYDMDALKEKIKLGIMQKPLGHDLDKGNLQNRSMNAIGG